MRFAVHFEEFNLRDSERKGKFNDKQTQKERYVGKNISAGRKVGQRNPS
jgi:hypothetical protein